MFTRISNAFLVSILLAGCGGASQEVPSPKPLRIACAVNGAPLEKACGLEEQKKGAGRLLLIRHPDGGFRRFEIVSDGRGVVIADGALPAQVRLIAPKLIEVVVEADVYQVPVTPMEAAPAA